MKRPLWLVLVCFSAAPLLPSIALAQRSGKPFNNASIQVQVRKPDGTSAPAGVSVELDLETGEPVYWGQTDSSGKCRFVPPDPAVYFVRAKQPGYLEAVARVDLQNSPTAMANLVLQPIPGQAPLGPPEGGGGPPVSARDLGVPDNARQEFEKGQKSLQEHNLDDGILHLKRAIKIYDSFPLAYTMLGTAYNEKKDWKEAEAALEKATELNPKAGEAYIQLGAAKRQNKDLPGAEKALAQGLELSPDAPDAAAAQYELAKIYMDMGQWQKAEPFALKSVTAAQDFPAAHLLMGNIFLKKGDGQGALNEFQTYLKLDPSGPMAPGVRDIIPKIQAAMQRQQQK